VLSFDKQDISVYIHIPFIIKARKGEDTLYVPATREKRNAYLQALEYEMMSAEDLLEGRKVASIYIGGGIATTVSPDKLARLILKFKRTYHIDSSIELTVTAAPQTVVSPSLSGLNMGGVNRLSFMALSPVDKLLETIQAPHRLEHIENGTFILNKFAYGNIDAVLMIGIPGQTLTTIKNTLTAFVALKGVKHITLKRYEFSEQEGVSLEAFEEQFNTVVELLTNKGLVQYTTDSFAYPGWESRFTLHSLSGMDRVGFGLGAKTYLDDFVSQNTTDFNHYLENAADFTKIISGAVELNEYDQLKRFVALRLQLLNGFSEQDYLSVFKDQPRELFNSVMDPVINAEWVSESHGNYRLTFKGLMASDQVISSVIGG